jgi:hypothetical protein
MKEGNHLGDLFVDVRIILNRILEKLVCEGVNWIQPAQDSVGYNGDIL